MFVTPAFAQALPFGGSDSVFQLLTPMVLVFVIFYFLVLRPQHKRTKEHQEMVKNLRRGDTVVQAMVKSAARTMGSTVGRQIIRGVLGSLLGGSSSSRR